MPQLKFSKSRQVDFIIVPGRQVAWETAQVARSLLTPLEPQ